MSIKIGCLKYTNRSPAMAASTQLTAAAYISAYIALRVIDTIHKLYTKHICCNIIARWKICLILDYWILDFYL